MRGPLAPRASAARVDRGERSTAKPNIGEYLRAASSSQTVSTIVSFLERTTKEGSVQKMDRIRGGQNPLRPYVNLVAQVGPSTKLPPGGNGPSWFFRKAVPEASPSMTACPSLAKQTIYDNTKWPWCLLRIFA